MKIQIIVVDDNDEVLCKRESLSFESAGEDLGKLERFINSGNISHDCKLAEKGFCDVCYPEGIIT